MSLHGKKEGLNIEYNDDNSCRGQQYLEIPDIIWLES